ncbi:MAG: S46 family peptidase [Acidobacteriota bacterium]
MWTYDHPPLQLLQKEFGFTPTQAWLDHLRLASVGIGGASGSFVSPDGLILTNHHVARAYLQQISTPGHNYVRDGFYAKRRSQELRLPGAVARVLVSLQDVTPLVDAAAKSGSSPAQALQAREAAIAGVERQCMERTGLRGEVVALFGGARYVLYRYKEYTDVRVVMAPEEKAAYFGGDADNFGYPRYDLDFAFLRAYQDGRPARTPDYLRIDPAGVGEGMPVFVSGNPAHTHRLATLAQLTYFRDLSYPAAAEDLAGTDKILTAYSGEGPRQAEETQSALFFLHNRLKVIRGELRGLEDPELMAEKARAGRALREAIAQRPDLKHCEQAWQQVRRAVQWQRDHFDEITYEGRVPDSTGLTGTALDILRYAEEVRRPDSDRLAGYHESQIPALLDNLEAPHSYSRALDEPLLAHALTVLRDKVGAADPYVKALLAGESPERRARELLGGTRLDDEAFRVSLLRNGGAAVRGCKDPLLSFARLLDPALRNIDAALRKNVEEVVQPALDEIARAQFALRGDALYPDATGTLRLAFGRVEGYSFDTTEVPFQTTFYGLYDRAYSFDDKGDFQLSETEAARRGQLALKTPLDFVCTADITGGNSGSPVVDEGGKLVGLVFDGNAPNIPNAFVHAQGNARCVAVDAPAIVQALTRLYDATRLVQELRQASE